MNKKRRNTILIALLCASSVLLAQPNGSFENWSPEFSYEVPDGWQTLNVMSLLSTPDKINPACVTRAGGVDKRSGFYALKLQSAFFPVNPGHNYQDPAASVIPDTTCACFLGKITIAPIGYREGIPYTGRPEKVQFYAKYTPVGGDRAYVGAYLKKYNPQTQLSDTIANGEITIEATPTYTHFEIPLQYTNDNAMPDSAVIGFFSSKRTFNARVGSTLFVDDVALTGWVGIDEQESIAEKLKVFPNPANEQLIIEIQSTEAQTITITDYIGKHIGDYKILGNATPIDTRTFPLGIYFYDIRNKNKKTLTTGKFVITK